MLSRYNSYFYCAGAAHSLIIIQGDCEFVVLCTFKDILAVQMDVEITLVMGIKLIIVYFIHIVHSTGHFCHLVPQGGLERP